MDVNDFKLKLVEEISNCDEILGIGQTGDINAPLIAGKSDIDILKSRINYTYVSRCLAQRVQ